MGWTREVVTRTGDMSPDGRLRVLIQKDGDVVLEIVPPERDKELRSVEFCTPFVGGGRSEHTLQALYNLVEAIKLDNEENPIPNSGNKFI